MPCSPDQNTLNPAIIFPPFVPGFGFPFAPPQIPFPDITLPDGIPEDILALVRQFLALIPGGPFGPNLGNFAKTVIDAIASLLNILAPYLGLYRFLQALLNMILCIIDVLCAATNPFAMLKALKKLFKECLPPFINLFPWLALIAMIIAILLLLLALIEYLIQQILALLNDIIQNLIELGDALGFQDAERQLAGVRKIAQLLCMIEQLFAILVAFQAILAIVRALAALTGRKVCLKGDSDCCTDDVCPNFIFNNPDGFGDVVGTLSYHKEIDNDSSLLPPGVVVPPIRIESWQFYDDNIAEVYKFADIITPVDGSTFWPDGKSFTEDSNLKQVPYTVDLSLSVNPAAFGHTDPIGTQRIFKIKDTIIGVRPTKSLVAYNGSKSTIVNGVVNLTGGLVYEEDGTTPFNISGQQATLNTFIHQTPGIGSPATEDGYFISNITWTMKINHPSLVGIISMGCVPDLQIEAAVLNSTIDISDVFTKMGPLPDINGTINCLQNSIARIRANVSSENLATEQAVMVDCLNNLRDQTISSYTNAINAGTDQYGSTIELDTDLQFVSLPITATVTLKDSGGNVLSSGVPSDAQDALASKLTGIVTVGDIGPFEFDGYQGFKALITSEVAGTGQLKVLFDGRVLSTIINRDNDSPTSIIENIKTYTFVGVASDHQEAPRRDEGDIARDG